jgi:hypothetical protein
MKKTGMTPAETITTYMQLVNVQLSVSPNTSRDWMVISRRLRASADAARKIAIIAERMEAPVSTEVDTPVTTEL